MNALHFRNVAGYVPYRIDNRGIVAQLKAGNRMVLALVPGTSNGYDVTIVDWATLNVIKVRIGNWMRMQPQETTADAYWLAVHMRPRIAKRSRVPAEIREIEAALQQLITSKGVRLIEGKP